MFLELNQVESGVGDLRVTGCGGVHAADDLDLLDADPLAIVIPATHSDDGGHEMQASRGTGAISDKKQSQLASIKSRCEIDRLCSDQNPR